MTNLTKITCKIIVRIVVNMMSLKNRAKNINEGKNIDITLLDFDMQGYDANQICKKVINKEKYKQSLL